MNSFMYYHFYCLSHQQFKKNHSGGQIFSRQNRFNFFHHHFSKKIHSSSLCAARQIPKKQSSCEFISKHEIFLSRKKMISFALVSIEKKKILQIKIFGFFKNSIDWHYFLQMHQLLPIYGMGYLLKNLSIARVKTLFFLKWVFKSPFKIQILLK